MENRSACIADKILPKKDPKTRLRKLAAIARFIRGVRIGEKSRPLRLHEPPSSREAGDEPATITAVFCRKNRGSIDERSSIP